MGFNPANIPGLNNVKVRQQQAFRKPNDRQFNQQEVVTPRLVYQYKIVPNDNANNGYILGVLDWYGQERHVKITMSDEAYQAQKARDAESKKTYEGNFNGAYIDSKMEAKLKFLESNQTDKKFVIGLEGAIFKANKVEKLNGIEYIPVVVRRIINFKSAAKAIEGFFTASGYYDKDIEAYRVSAIESWSKNPIRFDDEENISKLDEMLDVINTNRDLYESGDRSVDMLPNLGVRFIASHVTKGKEKDSEEEVVLSRKIFDSSSAMDVLQLEDNTYRPLSKTFMHQMMEGYAHYILNSEDGVAKTYGVPESEVLLEIVPFKVFRTSTIESTFSLNTTNENVKRRPLYQMIQTPYLNSLSEDETPTVGRNLAFTGFIKITKNKVDEDTGKVTIQSFVTSVNFGTLRGNALSFIRNGEDDKKYEIEERIRQRYFTEEEKIEIEKRKEEKLLKEGKPAGSSLSKDSSLNPPSSLSLQSAPSAEAHDASLDADNLFSEEKKVEVKPEPSVSVDDDDDIPF